MFFTFVRVLLITLCCTASGLHAVHFLQVEKYQTKALWEHFKRPSANPLVRNALPAVAFMLIDWYLPMLLSMAIVKQEQRETLCGWLVLAAFVIVGGFIAWHKTRLPVKRSFTLTRRALRLMIAALLVNLLGVITLNLLDLSPYLFYAVADYVVWVSALIMRPVENAINARYSHAAKAKLDKRKKLIRIGITGSYGKTETKQILKTILAEKYCVLATPPAFSTAVGISRVVNDQLDKRHRVFIAEFGGDSKAEVRDMTKLVSPRFGILTCVGQRRGYGAIEDEAQINYALIKALPENGVAFFGAEGSYTGRLFSMCKREKYRCGMSGGDVLPDIRIEDAEKGPDGTSFTLVRKDGESMRMHTRLLGRFSLRGVALSAAVAIKLGLSMEQIAAGVEKIKPLKHRLELIDGPIHIIDDSENDTPEAAEAGLEALAAFPGRRIVLTAGFENPTGDAAFESACFAVGQRAAACADYIILSGHEDTKAIRQGLADAKFPPAQIRSFEEIEDAVSCLKEVAVEGDSVLWEGISPEDAEL